MAFLRPGAMPTRATTTAWISGGVTWKMRSLLRKRLGLVFLRSQSRLE